MKGMFVAILLLMGAQEPAGAEDWSLQTDKKLHFAAGAIIGTLNPVMRSSGTDHDSILAPMITSAVVASAKEFYDSREGQWSWADIGYTMAGTALSISFWERFRMGLTPEGIRIVGRW